MIEVIKPGLETSVQELPGRLGYWAQGFPPSGPMDAWSFRMANLLVGNKRDTAALECQFIGPSLRITQDGWAAVTGADMGATLDGVPVEAWVSLPVRAGQTLALGGAKAGARGYVAFAGGIDVPQVLGSRATFHMAGVGGYALRAGQRLALGPAGPVRPCRVPDVARPAIPRTRAWTVEAVRGPNDSWLTGEAIARFYGSDWTVQAKSSRTGIRLTGPAFTFAERAFHKRPEHGQDPSNILDHGYPLGAVNLAGQTPIILVNDAPSTGGFVNPFTVASAAFWKLAHARPGDVLRFREVTVREAQDLRRAMDALCHEGSLAEV